MRDKAYRMNSTLSVKNDTVPRTRILMNTCISMKRRTRAKKNMNAGRKKTTMTKMIMKKMKTRSMSGTISLTGSSLQTLYCP